MTHGDFDLIEQTLAIRLPEEYRRRLCPFPVPQIAGNTDAHVWDDARRLIALNEALRAEVEGWPPWLFALGRSDGDPCGYAIDTRSPDCRVWWLERMALGPASGPAEGPFADWLSRWVADTAPGEPSGRPRLRFLVTWLAASVLALIACWLWLIRRG